MTFQPATTWPVSCCVVAEFVGVLGVKVVLGQLIVRLQLFHHAHEDNAAGVRLPRALLIKVVDCPRDVMFLATARE